MKFDSIDSLKETGFEGFVTVATLWDEGYKNIPLSKGVYLIVRNTNKPHKILPQSKGGWFHNEDPTIPKHLLEERWVERAIVVYIGQAGGKKAGKETSATLQHRLKTYMKFGKGLKAAHRGGKSIWQLEDAPDLLVCWFPILNEDPGDVETRLIQEFKQQYNGKCPFANSAKCKDKKISKPIKR